MKDSEFIELLNLYLDHEIDPDQAARLEAAVAGNPDRRRVYQQYCRIQKACRMLAEQGVAPAPVVLDEKVVAFPAPRRAAFAAFSAAGFLAAAAAVAVVFSWHSHVAPHAAAAPAATVVAQATVPVQAAAIPSRDTFRPVLDEHAFSLANFSSAPAPVVWPSLDSNPSLAWISRMPAIPSAAPDFSTPSPASLLGAKPIFVNGLRPFENSNPDQSDAGDLEMAAFQFQR